MKKYILLLVPIFYISILDVLQAQNTAPLINIENIYFDAENNQCTIEYLVSDNEQETVEISVALSRDEGTTYLFPIENVEGIGSVATNENLTLTLTVNTDSLNRYNLSANELLFKIIAKDKAAVDINAMINQVNPQLLRDYMSQIEGIRHQTAGRDQYLITQQLLENMVADGNFQNRSQVYNSIGTESKNVIGRKAGHLAEDSTYMISAHYDTVDESPGADDNGSGVCGLMAALAILKDYEFEKSLLIAAFDDEEIGLVGSSAFVNKEIRAYETIAGLLNLEMIGYYSEEPNSQTLPGGFELIFEEQSKVVKENDFRGDFIINTGNDNSVDLMNAFNSAALTYVPNLKVIALKSPGDGRAIADLARSDHAPFWLNGYSALMITDGANFRNPYYHSPEDKSEHLNFEFMTQVVKATLATLAQQAGIISLGYAEGSFGNKVSVPTLQANPNFKFTLSGKGKHRLVNYQLPNKINEGQLILSNMKGQQLKTQYLNDNTATIGVDLPIEGLYILTVQIKGYQSFTKRLVYY